MSKRSKFLDVEQQHRLVAAFQPQRHIHQQSDCDGQQPLFDAPLPARRAAPSPRPELDVEHERHTPEHIDMLKRVLVAKYLRRCLKCTYKHIGTLLNVDAGTACRLDHYKLSGDWALEREPHPADEILAAPGMNEIRSPGGRH